MEMSLADRNLPSIQALFTTTTTAIQTFFNNNNILMLYLQQQHPSNLFKTTISFRRIYNNHILQTYLQQQYHSDVFTTTATTITSVRHIYNNTQSLFQQQQP